MENAIKITALVAAECILANCGLSFRGWEWWAIHVLYGIYFWR